MSEKISSRLPEVSRRLKVFLCHSSGDKEKVRELYHRLKTDGFDPWLDEEKLHGGQHWRTAIEKEVRTADVIVVCLTPNSITKRGFVQKEIKFALDTADEIPEGTIFIIPLKFEECQVPYGLQQWQWINYFAENQEQAYKGLVKTLNLRAADLRFPPNEVIQGLNSPDPKIQQWAASKRLAFRLEALQPINNRTEIDMDYLTCAEYQLFLDDTWEHKQPDHWDDYHFPKGEANQPLTGLRAEDAATFCQWLNNKQFLTDVRYRLPTSTEALQYPAALTGLFCWCQDGEKFVPLDLSTSTQQSLREAFTKLGKERLPLPVSLTAFFFQVEKRKDAIKHPLDTLSAILLDDVVTDKHARALALALDHANARELILNSALALDHARARWHTLDRDHELDSKLEEGRRLAKRLGWYFNPYEEREPLRESIIAEELALEIKRILDFTSTLTDSTNALIARDRILNRASTHDPLLELAHKFEEIYSAIKVGELSKAQELVSHFQNHSDLYLARRATLIYHLLEIGQAKSPQQLRQNWRNYSIKLTEYIYLGLEELIKVDKRDPAMVNEEQQQILSLYWWLQIIQARSQGKFPIWEGLRIVKERVD